MEPRWRKSMYVGTLAYRGGTEAFDIGLTDDGTLWIIWSDQPFCWATFDRVEFAALKRGKTLSDRLRIKQSELRALRNYVRLFVPEFEMEDTSDAETTL